MKIIFSRKGFDDAYGGGASPILPDGSLLSIPIPVKSEESGVPYKELIYEDRTYPEILNELGIKLPTKKCHLDPDLINRRTSSITNWQPAFGQQGAAAKHLINENVEPGDLFLFFGTFKRTFLDHKGKVTYEKDYPRHIVFGYLQIGRCYEVNKMTKKERKQFGWHPHLQNDYGNNNLLFTAAKSNHGLRKTSGILKYNSDLVLTRDGYRKSIWELPAAFHFDNGTSISRHLKESRFQLRGGKTILQTIGIGQDFVVHSDGKAISKWALNLVKRNLA